MTTRLWLIGGTQESRWLIENLQGQALTAEAAEPGAARAIVSVTTEAARALYPAAWQSRLWVGKLQPSRGAQFVAEQGIGAILDMSHPFATQISQLAIALAQKLHLPYLRYERATVSSPVEPWRDRQGRCGYVDLPDLDNLLTGNYLAGERTLLTLGYRMLSAFEPWQTRGTLFARILPSPTALQAALAAGFTPARLIALRPPISAACETALWQQWEISQVVTKSSGQAGGEAQKQAIAAALGVRLICLARPAIAYPAQTDSLDTALSFALRYCA